MFPSAVPSRGTCLPKRRSILCRKPSASVCLCWCLSVSARSPVAVLRATCCPRPEGAVRAACCGSLVAFSDHCALSEPVGCGIFGSAGIFSVCMSLRVACPLLPQSDVRSPACMDFSGSVFCAECHPLSYDHPCSYRKWLGKQAKGVGGGHGRENVPLPLPTPQTHQEVFFTCRMRTGPNGARGWERARAWNHPSRPDRPPPPLTSAIWELLRGPERARCSPVSTSHQPLPID